MKRNALVSAFCALLFTNILVAANVKDVDGLIGKCAHGDRKACGKLTAAVRELTDQALLAKVAVESKDPVVRGAAVRKLTGQALLAKIALEDEAPDVRGAAVGKLTNQALLAKIAVESKDPVVRGAAVEKLTDQAVVRGAAVGKLTYQALLAKIAAIGKLTDQALLAKIALDDEDPVVRGAAAGKLTDQAVLAKIAVESEDPVIRTKAIAAMDGSNPALRRLAGLGGLSLSGRACSGDSCITGTSIAHIKLAIQEPRIRSRLPGIVFAASVSAESRSYSGGGQVGDSVRRVSFCRTQPSREDLGREALEHRVSNAIRLSCSFLACWGPWRGPPGGTIAQRGIHAGRFG